MSDKKQAITWLREFKTLASKGSQDRNLGRGRLINRGGDCCVFGAALIGMKRRVGDIQKFTNGDAEVLVRVKLGLFPQAIESKLTDPQGSPVRHIETYLMEYNDNFAIDWQAMFAEIDRLIALVEAL